MLARASSRKLKLAAMLSFPESIMHDRNRAASGLHLEVVPHVGLQSYALSARIHAR